MISSKKKTYQLLWPQSQGASSGRSQTAFTERYLQNGVHQIQENNTNHND